MQVLLVEDNPVNRTLTRRLLEKLGCQVMTANDGEAAPSPVPDPPIRCDHDGLRDAPGRRF